MRILIACIGILTLTACSSQQATVLTEPISFPEPSSIATQSLSSSYSLSSLQSSYSSNSSASSQSSLPSSLRIALPFASQAPTGNWDDPYQEACEEASLILVHHYVQKSHIDADTMDTEILDLVQWEQENGFAEDVTIEELEMIAQKYYGYQTKSWEGNDVTIQAIETQLANGNPVIIPLAGQDIGNPYYSGDGPEFHMLVIVGYDGKHFLTHDVGTKRGEYFKYRKEVLFDAIHDWTGSKQSIRQGKKAMMIVQ